MYKKLVFITVLAGCAMSLPTASGATAHITELITTTHAPNRAGLDFFSQHDISRIKPVKIEKPAAWVRFLAKGYPLFAWFMNMKTVFCKKIVQIAYYARQLLKDHLITNTGS